MMKYDILVIPNFLDSKMIGIEKCQMTTMMMINKVNTMTPRQNDLVVKKTFARVHSEHFQGFTVNRFRSV